MKRALLLFCLLLSVKYTIGQSLRVERIDSEVLSICAEAQWQYDIENRSAEILEDIEVDLMYPNGID
jgi:hypothetical protein